MTIISNLPALSTVTDSVIFPVVSGAITNKATFLQFRQYLGVVNISTSTLVNGSYIVSLGSDGTLTLPNQGSIATEGNGNVTLGAPYRLKLITDLGDNNWTWTFGGNELTFPNSTIQTTAWTGTVAYSNVTGTPSPYNLPTASTSTLGGVKVDGVTITINSSTGIITGANTYNLPIASTSTLGGVKIGPDSGLSILEDGSLSVTNQGRAVITGTIVIENITQSTSTNTGAFQVYGGIGIGGNIYAGGIMYSNGWAVSTNTVSTFNGGTINNSLTINSSTQSDSTITGALVVKGGAGIGGNLWSGEHYITYSTDNNPSYPSGFDAGLFIQNTFSDKTGVTLVGSSGGRVYLANSGTTFYLTAGSSVIDPTTSTGSTQILSANTTNVKILRNTAASNQTSGALQVAGGVGISGNLYAGNIFSNGVQLVNGGGGVTSRTTATATSASLSAGASGTYTINGYKGYALLSVQVSSAAWVCVYNSTASRSADSTRAITSDPNPGSGVIAEIITTGASTQYFSPSVVGYSSESSPSTAIPVKIYNNSSSTQAITVTLTLIQLEA